MASLTKTYTRDLSTAIAGKLWEAIKDADERRELEKSKASEEVKKAAVKLKKDDSNSIPVQDKDLRETVVRIFGPLEGKLLQTEGKVNTLSGKITSVAGSIADTQKLIINQNQILEDKFDMMLSIVGERSAVKKQKEAEDKFEQLEMNLEGALDLSKTFGYEKASGRGGFNLLGAILSNVIGRKLTRRLTRNLYKSIVPRGLQARARLLSRSVRPFRRIIAGGAGGLRSVRNSFITPVIKTLSQRIAKRFFTPGKLTRLGRTWVRGTLNEVGVASRLRGRIATSKLGGKGGISLASLAFRARLFQKTGQWNVDKVVDMLLKYADADKAATRVMTKAAAQTGGRKIGKKMTTSGLTAGARKVTKEAVEGAARKGGVKKVLKRSSGKVANELSEDFLSRGIISAFRNPLVQKRIINKLGKEGAEKVFGKLTLGGFKSVGVGPGTLYAFGEGLMRLSPFMGGSDPMGMLLSFGSAIPWGGWGVAILDILRDIDRFAFDQHILPTVMRGGPTNAEINNYFKDALDLDNAAQYERGNIKPTGGMGSSAGAISEILGVTKAFGDATGFSGEVQGQIDAANLGSYPIPRANYTFDVGGRSSIKGFDKQAQADERKELSLIRKRPDFPDDDEDDDNNGDTDSKTDPKNKDRWLIDPRGWNLFGGGGIGGDDNVKARTPIMGGDGATIEFWGQQGRDLSGEPGVDFSYKDYKSNYNLFPGYVLETGLLYGARYGNVVVVRSVDPSNGLEFDSLYSHFPDGGMAVKPGQVVSAGEYLGKVGFVSVDTPGVPQMQPNNAGNMSGWHTSVDFFEPGSSARYRNLSVIQSLVTGADGQSPVGLLEKLKPPSTSNDQSSLNNIEANSKLGSAMTGLVENGSMDRKLTQKKIASRLPIVIVNNQVIRSNSNPIVVNKSNNVDGDFFDAYNLAKFSV